ncbi:transcriptional regulator [Amycolatopsis sp. WAC 04182]|uniref:helix-turn-helix domain-containing protein n=1 Tax=Amycolatopsis sp. WAC 04182 TaxID=2203198 RepID=UPI000F788188|nr:helix-turn-helix transcriptional regulator [Amycolatopsis sp. WAC 04182]RSN60425.1 transcriptional regulator [Amycolatopsis sp. WAC 04182]
MTSGGAVPRPGLERLLRDGPFADALREAIRARGLSLERLRDHLRARGVSITAATLSYWQSGRSRPERRDSVLGLRHLEQVLEVAPGSLTALLGPPRARGRWPARADGLPEFGRYWPDRTRIDAAVSAVDTRWDERLTRISQHDVVSVGPGQEELSFRSRQVLRAEADGPDRWVVIVHIDEHDRPLPEVTSLRGCHPGRSVHRPEDGLLVMELLFERPLAKGETVITEHTLVNSAPFPHATNYERKFRLPTREYVLEIRFSPGVLPVRCRRYSEQDGHPAEWTEVVPCGDSAHGVALSFGPGRFGFEWDWDS